MSQQFANNASAVLAASIGTADTTITVTEQKNIPALEAGDYFLATLFLNSDPSHIEVVKVTGVTGNTWTIEREQEDTAPLAHDINTPVELRLTAGSLKALATSNLVGLSISAPTELKGGGTWSVTVDTTSYLSGVTVDQLEITWWDGVETITVTGVSMTIERVTPDYPADPVSVSVRAVDSLGNKSKLESTQAAILANQPPIGPITINHQTTIIKNGSFDVSLSGAADPDNDVTLTYEIVDGGGLVFAKAVGILSGEIVSATAPDVANNVDITFSVRATDGIAYTSTYTSTITVLAAQVIGVKMVATGGNGGTWAHIDKAGEEIATPNTGWFDSHPVFGGIVDQVIDGQYMVKVPKFYYKRGTAADGKQAWWISDQATSGFTVFPAFVLDGSEVDQFWYGKYQASYLGGKLQSVPGVLPRVSMSLTDFMEFAASRNNSEGVDGFRLQHYDMWLAIQWLYLIEKKSMDSQTTTGQGRVNGHSGAANVDAPDVSQATYRGMVGLWGNVYQWIDGARSYNGIIERRTYNGTWTSTGESVPNNGSSTYPQTFRMSSPDQFIPDTYQTGGGNNTTLPDYVNWLANGEYYPFVGGHWNDILNAGLWCILSGNYPGSSGTYFGSRLARIV